MAAPTKNFTDPSSYNARTNTQILPLVVFDNVARVLQPSIAFFPEKLFPFTLATATLVSPSPQPVPPSPIKVPIPPMGRAILVTFPAYYKEAGAPTGNRPTTGQIWPRTKRNG